ncbi:Gfo/Idh/MocA family protein [Acutalibacter sp.]|uniref:Gfo/Idh/MocA family protein n=1 Tax=Acutalibacter sp. TaxID=1918636 RepID=UPI00216C4B8B|nr:Gfo/Idh/MocA family oxidoreductase [Acutalibacter sp.]
MEQKPVKVAMIGVGAISGIYLKNMTHTFREVDLVGVCDLIPERAEKGAAYVREEIEKGAQVRDPKIYKDMFEAFNDPEVEVVLNLTRPYEHFEVTKQALLHGKHVYSEKPLGVDMEEANQLISLAEEKGLQIGGAPDTFMGAGIQTARHLIDSGMIGNVVGASCAMVCHGHETWHPDPEFYYKRGGGPMLDMGPYYITALVQLLGEVKGVMGMTKKTFPQRLITSEPHRGETIQVDVDTWLSGNLEFTSGAIAQVFTTFDVHYTAQSRFEVYGTQGSLMVPDPNTFGGPVLLLRPEDAAAAPKTDPGLARHGVPDFYAGWKEMPLLYDYPENSRGLGLADMCKALRTGRDHRANYQQQRHVLEVMTSFSKSCESRAYLPMETKYTRTAPMELNPMHGILD